MLILSRVCADFHDSRGRRIFSVAPRNLLSFLEAPEEIREDPLFDLLLAEGSLEAVRSVDHRRGQTRRAGRRGRTLRIPRRKTRRERTFRAGRRKARRVRNAGFPFPGGARR